MYSPLPIVTFKYIFQLIAPYQVGATGVNVIQNVGLELKQE